MDSRLRGNDDLGIELLATKDKLDVAYSIFNGEEIFRNIDILT
jgi:hypothetical protein